VELTLPAAGPDLSGCEQGIPRQTVRTVPVSGANCCGAGLRARSRMIPIGLRQFHRSRVISCISLENAPRLRRTTSMALQDDLWENALSVSCTGAVKQTHPVDRIVTIRLARSSVDAVPMGALPVAVCDEMNCTAKFPCPAASSHSPIRVARVSRLIGNLDTTAKPRGWQADFASGLLARIYLETSEPRDRVTFLPQTHETPLNRVAFPVSCAGHWPPKLLAGGFPPCPSQTPPIGLPF
jgi:hypothetical protein